MMSGLFSLRVLAALAIVLVLIGLTVGQTAKKAKNPGTQPEKIIKKNKVRKGPNLKELKKGSNYGPGCEEIYLPMCKGLVPYTHTKLPNQFNHTTQLEVYRHLERLWPYMDQSCSKNVRLLACSTYLPKCHGKHPPQGPCKKTCMQAKKKCAETLKELMGLNWADKFECKGLPARNCVKPMKDTKCANEHTHCVENSVMPFCGNLTFTWGTLPNMFGQCSVDELNAEMQQLDALVATNCHLHLKFLICGVYSPFCIRNEVPFTFPCREICDEIRQACEPHYKRLYHGLPWPQKLQCHRYPNSENTDIECVMPNEGSSFFGG